MKKQNIWLFSGIILIFISIILILLNISNEIPISSSATLIKISSEEKISYTYEECKNINTSKYIKRLFKKDYRLPMCPKTYIVLFDEFQDILFIFNEKNNENPTILTYDVTCDNFSGQC